MRDELIYSILNKTAWQMDVPRLFGVFHITALIITVVFAASAARLLTRKVCITDHTETTVLSGSQEEALKRILAATGWILALLELYKQLFLYFIVNGGTYDWWYFPFQLCSVPMYLCIMLPFVSKRLRSTFLTFMCGYTLISALAALIYPEDFLRPYITLTLHGFIWHGLLLFISLVIMLSGAADDSIRGLLCAAGLFAALCVLAVIINAAVEPYMQAIRSEHPAIVHTWAAMFYLNPYHMSPQPIVGTVQSKYGIAAGLILYAMVIIAVSSFVIKIAKKIIPNRY